MITILIQESKGFSFQIRIEDTLRLPPELIKKLMDALSMGFRWSRVLQPFAQTDDIIV